MLYLKILQQEHLIQVFQKSIKTYRYFRNLLVKKKLNTAKIRTIVAKNIKYKFFPNYSLFFPSKIFLNKKNQPFYLTFF